MDVYLDVLRTGILLAPTIGSRTQATVRCSSLGTEKAYPYIEAYTEFYSLEPEFGVWIRFYTRQNCVDG